MHEEERWEQAPMRLLSGNPWHGTACPLPHRMRPFAWVGIERLPHTGGAWAVRTTIGVQR